MEGISINKNNYNYRKKRSFLGKFVAMDDSFHFCNSSILGFLYSIIPFKPLFPITNLDENSEFAAEMARNYEFLICILVMVMDAVAGLLAIRAEKAQNRVVSQSVCSGKAKDDAFSQGLAATILLGLAHAIAKVLGGCICIRKKKHLPEPSANLLVGLLFMILSWITLAIGLSMLMAGTVENSKWKKSCEISSSHGLFLVGGIVCFIHGFCTVAYYVSATAAKREEQKKLKPNPSDPQRV